jgi:hypothetical protein
MLLCAFSSSILSILDANALWIAGDPWGFSMILIDLRGVVAPILESILFGTIFFISELLRKLQVYIYHLNFEIIDSNTSCPKAKASELLCKAARNICCKSCINLLHFCCES